MPLNLPIFFNVNLINLLNVIDKSIIEKTTSWPFVEARKLIKGGGCRVNDEVVRNELQIVNANDLNLDGIIKLSAGKKRHVLIRPI